MESYGATHVVNYTEENYWEVLKDIEFDVIYDCVSGEEWEHACELLHKKVRGLVRRKIEEFGRFF